MSITEATPVIGAIIAVISGLWRAYKAIEKQAYERVQAEARLAKAEEAVTQLTDERVTLNKKLAWWETEEAPRLHERIRVLDQALSRLSREGPSCV